MGEKENQYQREWYRKNKAKASLQRKHLRRRNVARAILEDARKADRKRNLVSDLDYEFIVTLISKPCSYCGDTDLRRTLDRLDNSLGHTKVNVVVACERCNYIRRHMPIDAWLALTGAVRAARRKGLFGSWTGVIHRREALEPLPPPKPLSVPEHGDLYRYTRYRCRCTACRAAAAKWKRERRAFLLGS